MAITDGELSSIVLSAAGDFMVWSLQVTPSALTFEHSTADEQFVIYGDVSLKLNFQFEEDSSFSAGRRASRPRC